MYHILHYLPPRGHPGYNPDLMVMDLAKLRGDKEYKASPNHTILNK